MSNSFDSDERAGWELIWRSGNIPPRYSSFAPPGGSVVQWAEHIPPGGFILDLGCGVGRHVTYLGGQGFRMAGVDISPSGIKLTEEACTERQIPFEGHVSDMNMLPWGDNTFDGVLSTSTIHHDLRADIMQSISEVWRVLKPGGLFLVDFNSTDTLDYQQLREQVAAGKLTEVEPNTFIDERPDLEFWDDGFLPHHFCDEADVRDLLSAYEIVKLYADLREIITENGSAKGGKWVAWARKPL